MSEDRKFALWNLGSVLLEQERFEEAIEKFALAAKLVPREARAFTLYGNSLAESGRYRDAIAQLHKASALDPDDPLPHHHKGYFLFQLGSYEEGWKEWRAAWQCYKRALDVQPWSAEQLEMAVSFADVLREIFKYYEASEGFYRRVLEQRRDDAGASAGRAILYQQWAKADAATPEIHARLNYLVRRASKLLQDQLGTGNNFQTFLSLADLYIETSDWTAAGEQLDLAASVCGGSRLKLVEVTKRRGLVCFRSEEHAEAVKNFRQALLVKPGDLTLRCNLGNALLKSKQFEAAQDEFAYVLKLAEGNIDALLGAAQVSIELADDGDPDQYRIAEQCLTAALSHGRNKESGSKRLVNSSKCLRNSEIAKIYYMRGYARTKSYEAGAPRIMPPALPSARSDFLKCKKNDPDNRKATAAIEKINKRLRRRGSELLVDFFGPVIIFGAGAAVFLRTWFGQTTPSSVTEASAYIALIFGSLLFMVAGLYLPKVLKLKVPGIELEKASVDQVSAPSTLGISRSGSLTS